MASRPYLIIGSGMTADAAVAGIRRVDKTHPILVLGAETYPPYKRPPLSKKLWTEERMEQVWCPSASRGDVEFRLGVTVSELEVDRHQVATADGAVYPYERLLLATGARPRTLGDLGLEEAPGVVYLRYLQDYLAIWRAIQQHERVAVIGGSFLGAEIAAALAAKGKTVTMIFPQPDVMGAWFPRDLAERVSNLYRQQGVRLIPNRRVTAVRKSGAGDRVEAGDEAVEADLVVAGLGVVPNQELAEKAGIRVADGIVVDSRLATSVPDIFAAGDVAAFPAGGDGPLARVEHEDNAVAQGRLAGQNLAGADLFYDHRPFFYSDLFHLGFEAIGELSSNLRTWGDWVDFGEEGVVYYFNADDRLVGVLNWNVWDGIPAARELIAEGGRYPDPTILAGRIRNGG